jgi:hypothetical protein
MVFVGTSTERIRFNYIRYFLDLERFLGLFSMEEGSADENNECNR